MIHLKTIFRIIGSLLLLLSGIFYLFSIASPFLEGNDLFGFLVSALTTTFAGLWCCIIGKGSNGEFSRRDSYITITICWVAFALFGSLPYWLGGHIPHFTDAFFESMSGFTTTGASILDNIESQPHALLLWRSLTQWLGGLGIVFFTVAILPIFGIDKVQLFAAESTGVSHRKVHSRVSVGSRWIFSIYMLLTMACAISLKVCGMDWFDAVNHALTTIATSGFSTRQASIGAFDSAQIEYVITLFMFLSGINYTLLFLLLFKGKLSGTVEYFGRRTSDMLDYRAVAPSNGYSSIPVNVGSMTNSGFEVELNANIINNRNFKWSVFANATYVKNEINELHPELNGEYISGSSILREGDSMYQSYLVKYQGVDPNTGLALYEAKWTADQWFQKTMSEADYKALTAEGNEEAYNAAVEASAILFGGGTSDALKKLDEATLLSVFEGVPQFEISRQALNEGVKAVELFTDHAAVFPSKGEMRKMAQGGGVSLNKEKLAAFDQVVTAADLLDDKYLLVQKGKKNYFLLIAK